MKVSAECMHCLVKRQAENIKKYPDEEKKAEYLGKVLGIIANNAAEEPAPVLLSHIGRLHEEYFGKPFSFDELKKGYNAMMLEKETEIRQKIREAADPLALALRFAQIGNFIDFGAMDSVDDGKLMEFLEQAEKVYPEIVAEIRNNNEDYNRKLCCCSVAHGLVQAACFIKDHWAQMELKLLYSLPGRGVLAAKALLQSIANLDQENLVPLYVAPTGDAATKIIDGLCPSYHIEKYIYMAYYIGKSEAGR